MKIVRRDKNLETRIIYRRFNLFSMRNQFASARKFPSNFWTHDCSFDCALDIKVCRFPEVI